MFQGSLEETKVQSHTLARAKHRTIELILQWNVWVLLWDLAWDEVWSRALSRVWRHDHFFAYLLLLFDHHDFSYPISLCKSYQEGTQDIDKFSNFLIPTDTCWVEHDDDTSWLSKDIQGRQEEQLTFHRIKDCCQVLELSIEEGHFRLLDWYRSQENRFDSESQS